MKVAIKIMIFGVLSFVLGAFSGAVIWMILKIMDVGTEVVWSDIPDALGLDGNIIYNIIVCLVGGMLIGIWQKKYGLLPDDMHQVMGRIKTDGGYPYNNIHIISIAALLPLIFGGALGPEAGLSGIIAGLCCFVGDRLKYKGDEVASLAETGIAATLAVVFNAPLFGIADRLEPDNKTEKYRERLISKRSRVFLYVMGVAGGMLAMKGLGVLLGGSSGIPRFDAYHEYGFKQWEWFLLLLATGVLFGLFYLVMNKITCFLGEKIKEHRILSCMIAGILVAVIGFYLPLSMFSGEHQMGELMSQWDEYSVMLLILTAIAKLFLVNVCVNFGWRGGNIFPIIFSGLAIGYAMATVTGMDGSFAAAVTIAALYGYIMRKPVTVVAVLLLAFPITYILPVLAAAFIASKVPVPKAFMHN